MATTTKAVVVLGASFGCCVYTRVVFVTVSPRKEGKLTATDASYLYLDTRSSSYVAKHSSHL